MARSNERPRPRFRQERLLVSAMDCDDFDVWLNLMMDDQRSTLECPGPDQESHLATCDHCRTSWSGAQLLHQAIQSWAPPPTPSAASLLQISRLRVPPRKPTRYSRLYRVALPLSAAAALLLLWAGHYSRVVNDRALAQRTAPLKLVAVANPRPPLSKAIQEATRATIDVARQASAPVARIGREALSLEDQPEDRESLDDDLILTPGSSRSEMIESLGKSVNEGVKPLSGSARHAFSFLLGPVTSPEPPVPPSDRATH